MLKWIKSFFASTNKEYELVEAATSDGGFEQGIKLLKPPYTGIVVTTSPKVSVKEIDGMLQLTFDISVRANPNKIQYQYDELHKFVGPILVDLISKDYDATGRDHPISTDEGL